MNKTTYIILYTVNLFQSYRPWLLSRAKANLDLVVMSVVMIAVVMFPMSGKAVAFITGATDAGIRDMKLPIPIQKAMTSPAASPTRAP